MTLNRPHPKLNLEPRFAFVGSPSDVSPAGIRRWILDVCSRLEITPTELARKAKLAPSTLNRFLAEKDGDKNLTARTISALIRAGQEMANFADPITFDNLAPYDMDAPAATYLIEVLVLGVARNEFQMEFQWDEDDMYTVKIPIPGPYHRYSLLGLEIGDSHASKNYPFGSLVIAVPYTSLERGPVHGEKVIALEISDDERVRATVREYLESPSGDGWLLPLGEDELTERYVGKVAGRNWWERENLKIAGKIIASYQLDKSIFAGTVGATKE